MIQRIQSLFLAFAAITSLIIIHYFPVLQKGDEFLMMNNNFQYARVCLYLSSFITIYTIFLYKNRRRQIILSSFARLLITGCLVLLLLEINNNMSISYGLFLLLIPYLSLFLAGRFIQKDEKLVRSADRIR